MVSKRLARHCNMNSIRVNARKRLLFFIILNCLGFNLCNLQQGFEFLFATPTFLGFSQPRGLVNTCRDFQSIELENFRVIQISTDISLFQFS
jgi:hypothetical protein